MQKSLFKKYLFMTMGIVLTSFIVLGATMTFFFTNQWKQEREDILYKNVSAISEFASDYIIESEAKSISVDVPALKILLSVLSKNINADIFITDLEGKRIIGTYPSKHNADDIINNSILEKAMNGKYTSADDLGGLYLTNHYTVGIPFTVKNADREEVVIGTIFASSNVDGVISYIQNILQVFLFAAIFSLVLTFIVVWLFTYKMIKPLTRMSYAAKAFGSGDFSVRVPVESTDEIGQLSLAFNNMANSLSNSEGTRRSFIANVSHELKTPMTTIGGFIDGILDGTIPVQRQANYLEIVSTEIKRLSRLVKSMLDLSRIDNGEMKLNPVKFDITATVFSTILTFEQKIVAKNLEIRGLEDAAPMNITGDQDLLHQVIYNLIENAVKFTNDNGYISFKFTDSFDRVCILIENSGKGIAPDELPMIFDKFYKTDKSRSQDKNGMGLGLYLVKTIANLHGGDVTVQSAVDNFCRFEIYLPKPVEKTIKLSDNKAIPLSSRKDIQDVE